MYLVELFLPLADNDNKPFPKAECSQVQQALADQFGGVTVYPRSPASGVWESEADEKQHDELIVFEVMADELDGEWWKNYRVALEAKFRQERILVRAQEVRLL